MKTRLTLLIFWFAGQIANLIGSVWMLLALVFSPRGTRAKRIAVSYDQLVNAATGGSEDETISSRAGRLMGTTRWACVLCKVLDWLDPDHCKKSIERPLNP